MEATAEADTARRQIQVRQTEDRVRRTAAAAVRSRAEAVPAAATAEISLEKMICLLFLIQWKRRRILHMQTRGIFLQFMAMILEMKHVLQPRCSMKYQSNTLLRQEKR